MSLLDALRQVTEVVPESGELSLVKRFGAKHVNLSTSMITAAAQQPEHHDVVDAAILWAQKQVGKGGNRKLVAIHAVERLELEFARSLLAQVDGSVSIDVDGRLAFKRRQTIDRARAILDQLAELGIDKERILLKIPATWEGIEAAHKLREKNGARCHMTLVFGIHQVAACADAGASVIAPAVGRISDWHKKQDGVDGYPPDRDPGVAAAIAMHDYLERHGYPSRLMPAMFRSADQALALAGSEMVSLPTTLLEELEGRQGEVDARVGVPGAQGRGTDKIEVDQATFKQLHAADELSKSKLASAVQNLSWAYVSQEKQLTDWITSRQDVAAESSTAMLFKIWDYDGDGYIDREEWNGTDEVFNALDKNGDGRISLEEMAVGLGAPHQPDEE